MDDLVIKTNIGKFSADEIHWNITVLVKHKGCC